MASPSRARLHLLLLWFAISMQACGLSLVATYSFNSLQAESSSGLGPVAIASWLGFACLPTLLLSPLIASLAGSSRAWLTLAVSGTVSLVVILVGAFVPDTPSISVFGVFALASAFFFCSAARLFFAALAELRLQPTSVVVLATFGIVLLLRVTFSQITDFPPASSTGGNKVLLFACLSTVFALLNAVFFRAPPKESVPLSQGMVRPFLAGTRDALRHRLGRNSLIGLWIWGFVAVSMLMVIRTERTDEPLSQSYGLGLLAGVVLAAINRHSYRCGWTIAYASASLFGELLFLEFNHYYELSILRNVFWIGIALGLVLPPLVHYYFTWTTPKYHGVAAALLLAGWCACGLILAILAFSRGPDVQIEQRTIISLLVKVTGVATLGAWLGFFRPTMEGTIEFLLWPVYRFRSRGPGCKNLPARGPCLVIANHSAWLDPLFMAKVLPPPIIPMMTSKFYDLPVISFLMRRVIGTIRVPEASYRHEAPELKEAIAALDRGECVVIFPEGFLRRKEEQPLRRFGRGIWAILVERPQTPVFACWIEGNWGSYFSYRGGPPTKGKRIDFWTHIDIGIVGPVPIDPALLADHLAVRSYLMHQVSGARVSLGLDALELPTAPAEGEKE